MNETEFYGSESDKAEKERLLGNAEFCMEEHKKAFENWNEGNIVEKIIAPTDGIVFFKQAEPLVNESDVVYRMIHRLHE